MNALRAVLALSIFAFAGIVFGQNGAGEGMRGSTPPGSSRDGSAPGDGAIKGGSILPGETGGQPNETRKPSTAEGLKRCYELSGTLRDQCLLQERGASTGGTSESTGKPAGPTVRDPVSAPPPQNPR
ncbi:MAG TPA: hypothetical protein VG591_02620 [Burkholderiales bacterium]|jgi:hypothetical protein|nr:hypothetical protein [Burkholderiales bacterium]